MNIHNLFSRLDQIGYRSLFWLQTATQHSPDNIVLSTDVFKPPNLIATLE